MNLRFLGKLGSIGAILAAATCAVCFPFLAVVGSAIGLGIFSRCEGITLYIFKLLVLIALIGNVISYLNHRKVIPLIVGVASPASIFFSLPLPGLEWVTLHIVVRPQESLRSLPLF